MLPLESTVSDKMLGLVAGAKPLRLTKRRYSAASSIHGWFSSPKAIGEAPFESLLERDAQSVSSADPQVEAYAVQCHRLTYFVPTADGAQRREYVPDLVLKMRDGRRVVVEVKAVALAEKSAWASVEPYICRAYQEDHSADFRLLTEKDIRLEPQLANAQVMLAHCGVPIPAAEMTILQAIEEIGPISIQGLGDILAQSGFSYQQTFMAVMRCAFSGKVSLDTTQEFSPSTPVWGG